MRPIGTIVVAALAGLVLASATTAQEIRVTESGRPAVGARVSTLINGIKTPRGVTGEDGRLELPDDLPIAAGTRVEIVRRACVDGRVEIVLAPAAEGDGCAAEAAAEGADCDCEPAGAIVWGEPDPILVDLGPVGVTPEVVAPALETASPPPVAYRPRYKVEAGVGYHAYGQMEDQACAGADSCTTDESAFAPFVQAELRPWPDHPFAFGAGFDRVSGLTTRQTVGGATNEVDLDITSLRVTAGWDAWSSETALVTLWGGIVQAWNEAVVRSLFGGEVQREDRSESGIRVLGGGSLEYRLADRWWGVAGYDYATGGGDDADARHAVRVGIGIDIGGGF